MEIQGRPSMARVVCLRPRAKNNDLAIVTINPLPQVQVTFQAIHEVLSDFLVHEKALGFKTILPTHLGQALARFRFPYQRDQLISEGPQQFGNVTLTFVEHNKGRNWRAFNFNRECWIMMMWFPQDYREDEYITNATSSFGRVMYWIDDPAYINRILVRARVSDLEDIPNFLVVTEGENHHG